MSHKLQTEIAKTGWRSVKDLAADKSVENVFCQNFTASQQGVGEVLSVPLCLDGDDRMVTEENRREYVELYINHVLNSSVHRQVPLPLKTMLSLSWLAKSHF